jgi:predicted nucleic acid binding AN1-type Zn finger protein
MKCTYLDCKKRAILVVGDCRYCKGSYCGMHRLPESHTCVSRQEIADQLKTRVDPVQKINYENSQQGGCR